MIEDDGYRASSQYRYWSYTKQKLAEIRQNTNLLAASKVKDAFQRARASQNGDQNSSNGATDSVINTLTVDEELEIVEWGSSKIVQMGEAMEPRIPSHIVVREGCSISLNCYH